MSEDPFSLATTRVLHGLKSWAETHGVKEKTKDVSSYGFNFVQLERSGGEGKLCSVGGQYLQLVESALKRYCCAVLARDCIHWPLCAQHSIRIILHKRFALNVMKQMTKSINLEWCGYHKNDVNSEFTVVMKLFRIIIKTSTISLFFFSE